MLPIPSLATKPRFPHALALTYHCCSDSARPLVLLQEGFQRQSLRPPCAETINTSLAGLKINPCPLLAARGQFGSTSATPSSVVSLSLSS